MNGYSTCLEVDELDELTFSVSTARFHFIVHVAMANERANKLNGTYRLLEIKFNFSYQNGENYLGKNCARFVFLFHLLSCATFSSCHKFCRGHSSRNNHSLQSVFVCGAFSIDTTRCSQSNSLTIEETSFCPCQ